MESGIAQGYLKEIYRRQGAERALGTTELGRALNVSPASASEMTDRLRVRGLVTKTASKGIVLTGKGRREAVSLLRRHRLSERFLADVLGMGWKDVHDEACRLERSISAEVESRLDDLLGHPPTCPHGNPIPDRHGQTVGETFVRLSALGEGRHARVGRIAEEGRRILDYLSGIGIQPERELTVQKVAPFEGPLLIRVGTAQYPLARAIADIIWVRET